MCFAKPKDPPPIRQAPQRDDNAALSQQARATALAARNVSGTVATSSLGDPNFGASVRKTKLLGGVGV